MIHLVRLGELKMTKYDKILIVTVFLISIIGIYISSLQLDSSSSKYLYIEVDGEVYKEVIFDENTEMSLEIESVYGYNNIVMESGYINMVSANCPDQICVVERRISRVGEMIICLPNRTLVEIRGVSDSDTDYISH